MICGHFKTFNFTHKERYCHDACSLLKKYLTESSMLKYLDVEKPYTLITYTSKYAWACVLIQTYTVMSLMARRR